MGLHLPVAVNSEGRVFHQQVFAPMDSLFQTTYGSVQYVQQISKHLEWAASFSSYGADRAAWAQNQFWAVGLKQSF
jgi:hypothetical protein